MNVVNSHRPSCKGSVFYAAGIKKRNGKERDKRKNTSVIGTKAKGVEV